MIVGVWLVYNSAATLPASAASVWPFIDAALFIDGDFDGNERSDDGTPGIVEEFSRSDSRLLQRLVPEKRRKPVAYLTWSGPYPCKKRNVYLEHELVREASWFGRWTATRCGPRRGPGGLAARRSRRRANATRSPLGCWHSPTRSHTTTGPHHRGVGPACTGRSAWPPGIISKAATSA